LVDSQIALDEGVLEDNCLELTFPQSAILYLRHTSRTPDVLTIKLHTPGGTHSYPVPVLKVQTYSVDEIFEKNLLFLIPFHIFCHEHSFKRYENNAGAMEELKAEYQEIRNRLDALCNTGAITEYTKCTIIDMSKKVLDSIAARYANVRKGVNQVMGGQILEYEAKTILNKGRKEGSEATFIELVRDGVLSAEEAAKRLKISVEEFKKLL